MQVVPTLNFGGNCREANDSKYNPLLKENQKEYIYHSELLLNDQRIIMSEHVDIKFQACVEWSLQINLVFDGEL